MLGKQTLCQLSYSRSEQAQVIAERERARIAASLPARELARRGDASLARIEPEHHLAERDDVPAAVLGRKDGEGGRCHRAIPPHGRHGQDIDCHLAPVGRTMRSGREEEKTGMLKRASWHPVGRRALQTALVALMVAAAMTVPASPVFAAETITISPTQPVYLVNNGATANVGFKMSYTGTPGSVTNLDRDITLSLTTRGRHPVR